MENFDLDDETFLPPISFWLQKYSVLKCSFGKSGSHVLFYEFFRRGGGCTRVFPAHWSSHKAKSSGLSLNNILTTCSCLILSDFVYLSSAQKLQTAAQTAAKIDKRLIKPTTTHGLLVLVSKVAPPQDLLEPGRTVKSENAETFSSFAPRLCLKHVFLQVVLLPHTHKFS